MKSISRLTALLGVLLVSSIAAADETAPQLVARYENLALGGPAVAVSNMTISSGSMKLTLNSGSAAPVKAGDEVIGIFFKGDGAFDYSANDAVELPIMQTNLRNTKSSAAVANGNLHGTFTDALIATQNVKLPALEGAAGQALDDAFAKNRAVFVNDKELLLSTQFAANALTTPSQRNVRFELRGNEEWVYAGDHREEFLARLYTLNFDDRARRVERYYAPISDRPVGRTRADIPPFDVVLTALDYSVVTDDNRNVAVTATETLMPRMNGARGLVLELDDQLHVDDGARPPRHYQVKSITTADGKELPFSHKNATLLVSLPQPTMAASPITLKFQLEGDILKQEGGDNQWVLRMGWFPLPPLAGIATTSHGVIKVKAPFVPFAGGKTISRRSEGEYNILEIQSDQPTAFVFVAAGKFFYEEEKRGELTVRTASYGQKNSRAIAKINGLAFDMIAYYEYFLGPYPGTELNILEMNGLGWGQAPAGIVFITSEAFQPLLGEENQLYSEGINERIAHEIAHQYWGTVVRMPSLEEQWLTEAFAEYSAALLLKKFQGDAPYKRLLAHWKAGANESHNLAPIPLANRITTPNNVDWNRVKLLYDKGPYLLAALNKQVGDEAFMTFLKSYQKSFRNKLGTTKDVAGLLGFMTKQDFKPFFDKYYWGTEIPDVK